MPPKWLAVLADLAGQGADSLELHDGPQAWAFPDDWSHAERLAFLKAIDAAQPFPLQIENTQVLRFLIGELEKS